AGIGNAGQHIPDLYTDAVDRGEATSGRRKWERRFLEAPRRQYFIPRWTRDVHVCNGDSAVTRVSAKVGAGAGLFGSIGCDGKQVHGSGSLVVGHVGGIGSWNRN